MALFHVKQSHRLETGHFHAKLTRFCLFPGFCGQFLPGVSVIRCDRLSIALVRNVRVPCHGWRAARAGSFTRWISLWITMCITLERSVDILRSLDAAVVEGRPHVVYKCPNFDQQTQGLRCLPSPRERVWTLWSRHVSRETTTVPPAADGEDILQPEGYVGSRLPIGRGTPIRA